MERVAACHGVLSRRLVTAACLGEGEAEDGRRSRRRKAKPKTEGLPKMEGREPGDGKARRRESEDEALEPETGG